MTKLHEIGVEYLEVLDMDAPVEQLQETIDLIEDDFNSKAVNLVKYTNSIDSDIKAVDEEIKRLQERKKVLSNKRDGFRDYLRINMEKSGINKIESPIFNVTLGKAADVVVIDEQDNLPDDFVECSMTIKPNKKAIKEALKDGEDVPGARLESGKSRLIIK